MAGTFPLMIELEENASFKTLALLNRIPGIAKIHFNLDALDRPRLARRQAGEQLLLPAPSKRVGPGTADGFSPSQEIIRILRQSGRAMTRKEIKEAGGVNGARILTNLTSMRKMGTIKKTGPGTYILGNVIEARANPVSVKHANGRGGEKKVGADLIIDALHKSKEPTIAMPQLRELFIADGRSPKSVADQVHKLVATKKIKKVAKGTYKLV